MKLFKALGDGQLLLNHHGRALFPLPNRTKTTITHLSNLLYNDDEDGASGGESMTVVMMVAMMMLRRSLAVSRTTSGLLKALELTPRALLLLLLEPWSLHVLDSP